MNAWARVAILLFAVGWGANHFVPLLLVYRERLHLTSVDVAILFGMYAVGLVPGLLLGGPLSDRHGRRVVVLPSALVALAGTLILATAHGFAVLLLGRLVVGAGSGAAFSAGTAWVQDLSSGTAEGVGARRAATALSSGFGGGPLVAGVVAQWLPHPMVLPYLVQAVTALGAVTLAWRAPDGHAHTDAHALPAKMPVLPPRFFGDIVAVAPWVFAFPSIAFAVFPSLVRDRLGHLAVAYAALVTATTLLAGVLLQPFVRAWSPRRAALGGLLFGLFGLLIGLFATAHGRPLGVVVAGLFLGAGYGACLIAGLRWIEASTPPAARGRVVGFFYLFTYLGFTAPFLLAALARHIGDAGGIALTAVLVALTAAHTMRRRWAHEA